LGKAYTYLRDGGAISRCDDKAWEGVSCATIRANDENPN